MAIPEKYWDRIQKEPSGCWLWTGATKSGYGVVGVRLPNGRDKQYKVHRLALTGFEGYDNPLFACHKCNNRLCCNPDHLYLGNPQDNYRDMVRAGAEGPGWKASQGQPIPPMPGAENPAAKLRWDDVRTIRALYSEGGHSQYDLARKYGLHQATIHAIVTHKSWKEAGGRR